MSTTTTVHEPLPPPHIVECVRQALLKAHGNNRVAIAHCLVKPVGADGENFCSAIYSVDVSYRVLRDDGIEATERTALIVKDMREEIAAVGSAEQQMYEGVLPQLERILSDGVSGKKTILSAKCLWAERGVRELYVLEDLTKGGWSLGDRERGLNAEHARVLLAKIAQFHAASMVYVERFPGEQKLPASHFSDGASDAVAKSITFGGMEYAARMVDTWPHYGGVAEKMRANMARFNERMLALVDPQASRLRVINHGDLWMNNFLFRHDTSCRDRDGPDGPPPNDVVLVDFQECFVGGLGIDLNYFLYTSVQLEVLQTRRYELLRDYYSALCETLAMCGAAGLTPTWQQLVDEMRRCAFMGYYAAVCELPICCMGRTASRGFTAAIFTDPAAMAEKRTLLYASERVQQTLRYALDYFDELGVLD